MLAQLAAALRRIAEALARFQPAEPPVARPTIEPTPADEEWQTSWASAMTGVAQEFAEDLKSLPPAERELASRRAGMLNNVASQLRSGKAAPTPRQGDATVPN